MIARSHEAGFTLPIALFAILVLVTTARALSLYGSESIAIAKLTRLGDQEYERIKTEVSFSPRSPEGCARLSTRARAAVVCADPLLPWRSSPTYQLPEGTIDYDSLFRGVVQCPHLIIESTSLTATTPTSARTCPLAGAFNGDVVRLENIKGAEIALGPSTETPVMLASPGYVRITLRLLTASKLVVVAGGDIEIERLENSGPQDIQVSLFSSLGNIQVRSVGPRIALLSNGRRAIGAPVTASSTTFPLPPFRAQALRGFVILN